jgi:hypothetical protein
MTTPLLYEIQLRRTSKDGPIVTRTQVDASRASFPKAAQDELVRRAHYAMAHDLVLVLKPRRRPYKTSSI